MRSSAACACAGRTGLWRCQRPSARPLPAHDVFCAGGEGLGVSGVTDSLPPSLLAASTSHLKQTGRTPNSRYGAGPADRLK